MKATREVHRGTAAGFGLLRVADRRARASSLRTGRVWQRLHLEATRLGLAMHPINRVPEVIDRDLELGRATPLAGLAAPETVTFAFRYGRALDPSGPSARRPASEVVTETPDVISRR